MAGVSGTGITISLDTAKALLEMNGPHAATAELRKAVEAAERTIGLTDSDAQYIADMVIRAVHEGGTWTLMLGGREAVIVPAASAVPAWRECILDLAYGSRIRVRQHNGAVETMRVRSTSAGMSMTIVNLEPDR